MFTIRPPPCSRMTGTTARQVRNIDATFTSITCRHSASGISVNARIGIEAEPGAARRPLVVALVPPEVRVGRERADVDRERADEAAQDLGLDRDPFVAVEADELGQLAGVDVVVALLEDHAADSMNTPT